MDRLERTRFGFGWKLLILETAVVTALVLMVKNISPDVRMILFVNLCLAALLAIVEELTRRTAAHVPHTAATRPCPGCEDVVRADLTYCPSCGHDFDDAPPAAP